VDPDGTAYLDAADQIETARAAYQAHVAGVDVEVHRPAEERRPVLAGVGPELL
jgi:hypothetical protein